MHAAKHVWHGHSINAVRRMDLEKKRRHSGHLRSHIYGNRSSCHVLKHSSSTCAANQICKRLALSRNIPSASSSALPASRIDFCCHVEKTGANMTQMRPLPSSMRRASCGSQGSKLSRLDACKEADVLYSM